jgi:arylsulfatase A
VGVSWKGVIPSGVVSDYVFAFWDVMPTIADILNISTTQMPADIDGVSVADAWLNTGEPFHPPLYWEFCTVHVPTPLPPAVSDGDYALAGHLSSFATGHDGALEMPGAAASWGHAVRNGTWKAVSFYVNQTFELYDLSVDIGETTDVSAQHPDIIAAFDAFAKASHVNSPIFPVENCVGS